MERMTEHDMIGWFNAAPMGSRQQRMLWAAHKIARLTGATEGNVYQTLERSVERAGPPPSGPQFNGSAGSRPAALALWRSRARGSRTNSPRTGGATRAREARGRVQRRRRRPADHQDARPPVEAADRRPRRATVRLVQLEESVVFASQPVNALI